MPDNMTYWHKSWIKHNKDFNMILWDDNDNREFIEKYYPWFLDTYDNTDLVTYIDDDIYNTINEIITNKITNKHLTNYLKHSYRIYKK